MAVRMPQITVNHCLTKSGDGGPIPSKSELSTIELNDIRNFLTFHLDWDTGASEEVEASGANIVRVEFIYDGITKKLVIRDSVEADCIEGCPSPIIRYTLDKNVDPDEFKRCIWQSSMRYQPESRRIIDAEPYYAEDHNGYTEVVDFDRVSMEHKQRGVLISKVFEFPDGVEPYAGFDFSALDFAMPPQ